MRSLPTIVAAAALCGRWTDVLSHGLHRAGFASYRRTDSLPTLLPAVTALKIAGYMFGTCCGDLWTMSRNSGVSRCHEKNRTKCNVLGRIHPKIHSGLSNLAKWMCVHSAPGFQTRSDGSHHDCDEKESCRARTCLWMRALLGSVTSALVTAAATAVGSKLVSSRCGI